MICALDGGDLWEPRIAALFGGFERGGAPLVDFFVLTLPIEVDLGAFAFERHDARRAELGGAAHNVIHRGAFRERLAEREVKGEGRVSKRREDAQAGGGATGGGEFAGPLGALPIEGDYG